MDESKKDAPVRVPDKILKGVRSYDGLLDGLDEEIITAIDDDGSVSYLGLIRASGWHIQGRKKEDSVRGKLLNIAQGIEKRSGAFVISTTKEIIADGLEKAFFYDPLEMIRKVHRTNEITKEEYESDPLRTAHMEKAQPILGRASDIGMALALISALSAPEPPDYESARKATLAHIVKYLKLNEKETGCGLSVNAKIGSQMIEDAMYALYSVYHIEDMNNHMAAMQFLSADINSFTESMGEEGISAEEKDKLRTEWKAAEEQLLSSTTRFYTRIVTGSNKKTYEEARNISAERIVSVLKKVYPEKKEGKAGQLLDEIKSAKTKGAAPDPARYMKLPQAKHTNDLAHLVAKKITDPAQIDFIGRGTIVGSNDFRLFIEKFAELPKGISPSAARLLDALTIKAASTSGTVVSLPLKEYMELRGLKDERKVRAQVKADIRGLLSVSMEFREKRRGKYGNWVILKLGSGGSIVNGSIRFRFDEDYKAHLPTDQFMYLPSEYFSFNLKYNPHSAYFLRKAAFHKHINHGKPNEDIIGVETFINSSPNFPRKEDIGEALRVNQQIIEPFDRDMSAITEFSWEYVGEYPENYDQFVKAKVKLTWCSEYHELRTNDGSRKKLHKK